MNIFIYLYFKSDKNLIIKLFFLLNLKIKMNHYQSSDNINYINPLEYMTNSFSQSIHSTMIENKINSSNFYKANPLNRKRKRRNQNKILNRKINKILKSQKLTNKKLECIASILMSKFCNLDLYDYEHFEINIIKNVDDNDEKTIDENPYVSYDDDSKNEELENSQINDKSKDLENSKEDENESQNQNNNIQNQKNYDNKFSNLEINLNELHISSNKIKNKIYKKEDKNEYNLKLEEEEKEKEKENENEKINQENLNINNNNNDKYNILPKKKVEIEEIDNLNNLNINLEKNQENDDISMSNFSEEKNDIQKKISLSQQSNQSEKPLSSNMIKSSQDRFKKIRGFNFRNNIKNKKSFQQNEKNEINKLLNRGQNNDVPLNFNNKDNI